MRHHDEIEHAPLAPCVGGALVGVCENVVKAESILGCVERESDRCHWNGLRACLMPWYPANTSRNNDQGGLIHEAV